MASPASCIGNIVIQREDGLQIIDHIEYFQVVRNDEMKTSQALFPKSDGLNRILPYRWKKKLKVNFDSNLAVPTLTGWEAHFDIKNYDQTVLTNDKRLLKLVANLNREQKQIIQDLIIMNTTLEEMFKEQKNWLKENFGNIMLVIGMIVLAIAIFQLANQWQASASLQAQATQTLATSVTHFQAMLVNKVAGNVT